MSTEIVARVSGVRKLDYQGERVITLGMMDQLHGRPTGTAGRNFRKHRGKMLECRHFFEVDPSDLGSTKFVEPRHGGNRSVEVILLTQRGYLLLVKSFRDDLAWQVQDALVEHYFRSTEQLPSTHLVGHEIAAGIREGLKQGLEPLEKKVDEGFAEVNQRIDRLEKRRELTINTRRQHIDTILDFYGGRCPCCESIRIIDQFGNKLPAANDEHWEGPTKNRPHETWIVCRKCNIDLRDSHKFKLDKRTRFDSFQQRREQKHTPLFLECQ